jgi:AbrB family looped-hinge helix DNA binding protein
MAEPLFGRNIWEYISGVNTVIKMEYEVLVTRRGQTTIPAKLRAKYKIFEGTRLQVIETDDGILFKPKKSTADLAGSGNKYATPEEMKKLLDTLREDGQNSI